MTDPTAPTAPATMTDFLAARGLVPRPLTLAAYTPAAIADLRRTYDAYDQRARELGMSVLAVSGLAGACADILTCQTDATMVRRLAPLIGAAGRTVAETVALADKVLTYFLAERAPLSA